MYQSIPRFMLTWNCIELFSRPNRWIPFASSYLGFRCRSFASREGFMTLVHVHDDTFRSYRWSGDLFSRSIDIRRVALTNIWFLKKSLCIFSIRYFRCIIRISRMFSCNISLFFVIFIMVLNCSTHILSHIMYCKFSLNIFL